MEFAQKIASLREELIGSTVRPPSPPPDLVSGPELFRANATSQELGELFERADLGSVYSYLRGGKMLKIPPEWKAHFPRGSPDRPCDAARLQKKRKVSA